jgi:hypothetical protein
MRLVTLVHVGSDVSPARVDELAEVLVSLPGRVACLRRSCVGRHLPGSVGGGDLTWDALVEGGRDAVRAVLGAPDFEPLCGSGGPIDRLDVVALAPVASDVPEPEISDGVKRTLLLRVLPDADPRRVAGFERDVLAMPRHIEAIRNWSLSRADTDAQPTPWTHVWEQEYRDANGLEVDYMLHPHHWGVVDGWFDPECPGRVVDDVLAHVYCPAASTILGW